MKKQYWFSLFLFLFTVIGIPQVQAADTDYQLFMNCMNKTVATAGASCTKADLNGDGVIGQPDYTLFNAALKFDLNGDNIVEVTSTSADYTAFMGCMNQTLSGTSSATCKKADFNGDGVVGQPDYTLFLGTTKYDLNGDGKVDLNTTETVLDKSITITYPNGGEKLAAGFGKDVDFQVTWVSKNFSGNTSIYLKNEAGSTCLLGSAPVSQGKFGVIFKKGSDGKVYPCTNSPQQTIPSGPYKVILDTDTQVSGKNFSDDSDNFFALTVPFSQLNSIIDSATLENTSQGTNLGFNLKWKTKVPATVKVTLTCSPSISLYNKEGNTTQTCSTQSPIIINYPDLSTYNVASYGQSNTTYPVTVSMNVQASFESVGSVVEQDTRNVSVTYTPPKTSTQCPLETPPLCNADQALQRNPTQSNGCPGTFMCVNKAPSTPTTSPDIATLLKTIEELKRQIAILQGQVVTNNELPNETASFSYTWQNPLYVGLKNSDDVRALQNALLLEKVYTGPVTGYFGPMTFAAVKAFQEKYGISPVTGFVGELSRAKLNGLY